MMVSQLQSKSVHRSLTQHWNSVYMCLVSERSVLVDNQIFCDICKTILVESFHYLALLLDDFSPFIENNKIVRHTLSGMH